MDHRYDFFIAHAGADRESATELWKLLSESCRVFLASESLRPGSRWDDALPEAQRSSSITVVLISGNTDQAFYQREEIAHAIVLARSPEHRHRVIPLFLDTDGIPETLPYGLRRIHGVTVVESGGLRGVADKLREILLEQVEGSIPAAPPGGPDQLALARQWIADSVEAFDDDPRRALRLAKDAMDVSSLPEASAHLELALRKILPPFFPQPGSRYAGKLDSVELSPERQTLACYCSNTTLLLSTDGKCITELSGSRFSVLDENWSPDSSHLCIRSERSRDKVWIVARNGESLGSLGDWWSGVHSISWSPRSNRLVMVPYRGRSAYLMDTTGKKLAKLRSDKAKTLTGDVVWSSSGDFLLRGLMFDKGCALWSSEGQFIARVGTGGDWSPDGSRILCSGTQIYSSNGDLIASLDGHSVSSPWSPSGARFVLATKYGLHFSDRDGNLGDPFTEGMAQWMRWSPSGNWFVVNKGGQLIVFDVHGSVIAMHPCPPDVYEGHVEWAPKEPIITISRPNSIEFWDPSSGSVNRARLKLESVLRNIQWSPDSRRLLAFEDDERVSVWNDQGSCLMLIRKGPFSHTLDFSRLVWSWDCEYLLGQGREEVRLIPGCREALLASWRLAERSRSPESL